MKKFLAALALILAGCATAPTSATVVASFDAPHTNGVLFDSPCKNEKILQALIAAGIPSSILITVKAATGSYEGKSYGVCWTWNADESGAVIVWEDGGVFTVPRQALKFPLKV